MILSKILDIQAWHETVIFVLQIESFETEVVLPAAAYLLYFEVN